MADEPNPDHANQGEWPELDAIANIIERARVYSSEEQCTVKLSIQIELTGLEAKQIKERYIIAGAPTNVDNTEVFNQHADALKTIITEEMNAAFPNSIEEIPIQPNTKDYEQILETLTELVDEASAAPSKKPEPSVSLDMPNIISLKSLEDA